MNMTERVARRSFAFWRAHMDELGHHLDKARDFDAMPEGEKSFALALAKDMIEGMREPTQGMVCAAERKHGLLEGFKTEDGWRTMIDEALK